SDSTGGYARAEKALDALYTTVLRNIYSDGNDDREPEALKNYQCVVGAILAAKDALSLEALKSLLGLPECGIIVSRLGSILSIWYQGKGPIHLIHPSLFDFLTNERRCMDKRFYIDKKVSSRDLAVRCLAYMCECKLLKRNICHVDGPTIKGFYS